MWQKLSYLFRRKTFNPELDDEIRFHLEMATRERGESTAQREFGSLVRVREDSRSAWQVRWLVDLVSDLRYGLRALKRNPGFAAAAIFSLALGIGANTTIFSLTMEFLFSQPSCRNPETLAGMRIGGNSHANMPHYRFLRDAHIFEGLAGSREEAECNWRFGNDTYRLQVMRVTDNFFNVVGVPVAMGRPIAPGDRDVVVLSHHFWRARLAADTNVVGKALIIDGRPFTVAGVLPLNHRTVVGFGFAPEMYIPATEGDQVALIARLPQGMTIQGAYTRLISACKELDKVYPQGAGANSSWAINSEITPVVGWERLKSLNIAFLTAFFGILMAVVGLVLLIACANVSSLLLARASARRQELAIRLAIGAARGRIVRQLLAESLLLAGLGTCAGLMLNLGLTNFMNRVQLPLPLPVQLMIEPDWRLLLYSMAVATGSALVAGLVPALRATRGGVSTALKLEERQVGGRWTLRNGLVVGQLAVSVVLLTTGLLFVRNMAKSMSMNPGFDAEHAMWGQMRVVPAKYTTVEQTHGLVRNALSELGALPGIEAASIAHVVPFNANSVWGTLIQTDLGGQPIAARFHFNKVGPDYFKAMGIPLLQGREFLASDRKGAPAVAVLNENLARHLFGDRNPVGHTYRYAGPTPSAPVLVVGLAKNSKYMTLGEEDALAMYAPYFQDEDVLSDLQFLMRTERPRGVAKEIAQTLGRLDASAAIEVKPMRDAMGFAFLPSRMGAALLGSMGLLGLALASIGLYGVLAYSVARRTREIGLRVALGADRGAVLRMVARESAGLLAIGLAIGLGISIFATKPLAMFLVPELSPSDPATFLTVVGVLGAVAFAATLGPALRALRVDPMVALRYE